MELHGGYRHRASEQTGKPVEEWLDFSANINPFGMPDGMKEAMIKGMEELVHYPDPECRELTKAVANYERVEEERIYCGNGGADVLYRYIAAIDPKKILLPVPTFVEYEEILEHIEPQLKRSSIFYGKERESSCSDWKQGEKRELVSYYMNDSLELTEKFLDCMDSSYDLLILCSPNNPTGKVIEEALLHQIVEKAKEKEIYLLLDLSFSEFLSDQNETFLAYLKQQPHVTIVHSFTKMYGMPGIRIGYGVLGTSCFKEQMKKKGPTWSVNHLAQIAGLYALKQEDFVQKTVAYIERERDWLIKQLKSMGLFVIEGKANYILFQKKGDKTLDQRLLQKGILIRNCSNYRNLSKDYYRVAVKKREENERLIHRLQEEMKWQQNAL